MNAQRAKELLPIIAAFAEGKEIQSRDASQAAWITLLDPSWIDGASYRIKPKPKLRPWTQSEAIALIGKALVRLKRINASSEIGEVGLIFGVNKSRLFVASSPGITFEYALSDCECSFDGCATWLPCGVMETND